jgi:hypothetical protein
MRQFRLLYMAVEISPRSLFPVYVTPVAAATAFLNLSKFQQSQRSKK